MGNCLRSNKIVPLVVRDNADEMLARGTPSPRAENEEQEDMAKNLQKEDTDTQVAKAGVSFIVDFTHGKKGKKLSKIGKKDADAATKKELDMPQYTLEEKVLMAEILREDQLRVKIEEASKSFDTKHRRMVRIAEIVALKEQRELSDLLAEAEDTNYGGKAFRRVTDL